ncbi:MAG TPA: FecR domain-containing protein [Rhizomicrobium sp.]|jgi:transmembrane sensor|nr:FecR domain-containing protein [Rhizomicrobium sp.]
MSAASEMRHDEIEVRAADWLVARRVRDDWDEEKQSALDAWLEQSPLHRVTYLRLEGAWSRTHRLRAIHQPEPIEKPAKAAYPRLRNMLAGFAVAAIGLAGLGAYLSLPREQTYATALGQHRAVTLADGSHVELNTNTLLRVNAARKIAWLDHGEAFFEVHHDASHPFVVMAGDKRITDVGTKFIARRDGDRFEADVVEGRVQFEGGIAHKPALLRQGDSVVADANSVTMPKKTAIDLARELGWRHGVLIFDATPLGDAAAEFNRYNADKIIIADDTTARLSLGGTFRTNDGEAFVRLAQQVLGLRIKHYPNETVISR